MTSRSALPAHGVTDEAYSAGFTKYFSLTDRHSPNPTPPPSPLLASPRSDTDGDDNIRQKDKTGSIGKTYFQKAREEFSPQTLEIDWSDIQPAEHLQPESPREPRDTFPFCIVVPKKERTLAPEIGKIGQDRFRNKFNVQSLNNFRPIYEKGMPLHRRFCYVVNIPFLAKNGEHDAKKLQQLVSMFNEQAFAGYSDSYLELKNRLVVVIGINKFRSIIESNNAVRDELVKAPLSGIDFTLLRHGFYWEPCWQEQYWNSTKNEYDYRDVDFARVQNYYEQQVKKDPAREATLRQKIIEEEKKVNRAAVPFGEIRDTIMHDPNTVQAMAQILATKEHLCYFCTMDADLEKLTVPGHASQGVFSQYDRFLEGFSEHYKLNVAYFQDYVAQLPSFLWGSFRISSRKDSMLHMQWDLTLRIQQAVAKIFPRGVYPSETNTAIKIQNLDLLQRVSFGSGANEMKHFLDSLEKTQPAEQEKREHFWLVPDAAITTSIPDRYRRLFQAYVYGGKVCRWDHRDWQTMRTVIGTIHPRNWAVCVSGGLPPPLMRGNSGIPITQTRMQDQIMRLLPAIFHIYDPISYALEEIKPPPSRAKEGTVQDYNKKYFYPRLRYAIQKAKEHQFFDDTRKEKICDILSELRVYFELDVVKNINETAIQTGAVIADFISSKFELIHPPRDPIKGLGFTCMGILIKRLSPTQLDFFKEYEKYSLQAWEAKQKVLTKDFDGHGSYAEDFLSQLHIATFRQEHDQMTTFIKKDPSFVNKPFRKSLYPLTIALYNRDMQALIPLVLAGLSLESGLSEIDQAISRMKIRNRRALASADASEEEDNKATQDLNALDLARLMLRKFDDVTEEEKESINWDNFIKPMAELSDLTPLHIAVLFARKEWIVKAIAEDAITTLPTSFPDRCDTISWVLKFSQTANDVYSEIAIMLYRTQPNLVTTNHPYLLEQLFRIGISTEIIELAQWYIGDTKFMDAQDDTSHTDLFDHARQSSTSLVDIITDRFRKGDLMQDDVNDQLIELCIALVKSDSRHNPNSLFFAIIDIDEEDDVYQTFYYRLSAKWISESLLDYDFKKAEQFFTEMDEAFSAEYFKTIRKDYGVELMEHVKPVTFRNCLVRALGTNHEGTCDFLLNVCLHELPIDDLIKALDRFLTKNIIERHKNKKWFKDCIKEIIDKKQEQVRESLKNKYCEIQAFKELICTILYDSLKANHPIRSRILINLFGEIKLSTQRLTELNHPGISKEIAAVLKELNKS